MQGVDDVKGVHRAARAALALGTVLALAVASPASASLVFASDVVMNQPGYNFMTPQIGGRYVVAQRDAATSDIVVYDRRTDTDVSIGYGDGANQTSPAISGSRVVWASDADGDSEIWYDDRSDAEPPAKITGDSNDDVGPRIDGNYVVWMNGILPGRTIGYFDMEHHTSGTVPGTNLPNGITVDHGRICWYDTDKRAGYDGVYLYDIATGEETVVIERAWATTEIVPSSPAIHNDSVAWAQYAVATPDNKDIWIKNVRSGTAGQVTADSDTQTSPSVFGDILAWQDDRNGNEDILCWWQPELGFQDVAVNVNHEEYPDVFGHAVASQRYVEPGGEYRVELSVAPMEALRIAGADRYETSAMVSAERFPASTNAVLATGEDFPDALSASALAGALDAPLLLTREAAVPDSVLAEMARLGVNNVWLVGGTAVISDTVIDQLVDLGMTVQRVAGNDRYDTAKFVAYWVMDIVQSNPEAAWRGTAFFVRGDEFPDALAVAPHAYAQKIPILLVRPDSVPGPTEEAVTFAYITEGVIVGGTGAVSAATASDIGDLLGDAAVRWDGDDRYETAARCASEGVARGWLDYDTIGVATGTNFPDALGGGAACGSYGSPLVLTAPTYVPAALDTFFCERMYDFGGMAVLGGTGAVSDDTFTDLQGYLF